MRKRIAIAIGRVAGGSTFPDDQWHQYAEYADAVLAAMREPTEAMIDAGRQGDPLSCDVDEADVATVYSSIWRAMIDAAV